MKWYNQRAYKQHIKDLQYLDISDWRKKLCLEFVNSVANTFDRSYPRIGILDINDLIQEGYLSALTNWKRLNWDKINSLPKDEQQAMVWNYIQLGIKHGIIYSIQQNRDGIKIPRNYYYAQYQGKEYNADIFLTRTFASFFNDDYAEMLEYQGESYENERLNEFLHDVMDEFLNNITKQIVMMFYGMNEPNDTRKSIKDIAKWLNSSPHATDKKKQRGINRLKQEDAVEQIENYLLNSVQ